MTAKEYITLRAPTFAIDPSIDDLISAATDLISESAFGINYSKAIALLVCHQMAINVRDASSGGSSPSGNISSQKTGGLSISYSGGFFTGTVQSAIDPYLAQTAWGIELYHLKQSYIPTMFSRRM